jgi:IS6 family transposase
MARPFRHAGGDRWFVEETYVKVAGRWRYLYRVVDQFGQVIDVRLADRRNLSAAREFFCSALAQTCHPVEVTTDRAAAYPRALDELLPAVHHVVAQYANNPVECDHGRLKSRLRPMRRLKRRRSAIVVAAGHAFVQNIRRGHYELALDVSPRHRTSACSGSSRCSTAVRNPRHARSNGGRSLGAAATAAPSAGSKGSSRTTDSLVGKCRKKVM